MFMTAGRLKRSYDMEDLFNFEKLLSANAPVTGSVTTTVRELPRLG